MSGSTAPPNRAGPVLIDTELGQLNAICEELEGHEPGHPARVEPLRAALRLRRAFNERTEEVLDGPQSSDPEVERLHALASIGVQELGAAADPPTWSLRSYDAARYGPLFGVSDDGDAAPKIVRAFLDSPKANVLRDLNALNPQTVGACLDAERMSAAGELLVGPPEFSKILRSTEGRVPMTTNVGTIVLPRFFRPCPTITVQKGADPVDSAVDALRAEFSEYVERDGRPARPITVYVNFRSWKFRKSEKVEVLRRLRKAVEGGTFCDPTVHRLGLLQRVKTRAVRAAGFALDVAAQANLKHVMIEGDMRLEAQDQVVLPGLLSYFEADTVNSIMKKAQGLRVVVRAKNEIDVGTAARTIWSGLTAARGLGAQLGKFGLFPLSFEQQIEALRMIAAWFPTWTPSPAFYVDRPMMTKDQVFSERQLVDLAIRWVEEAAAGGARVALFDAPDRSPAPAGTSQRAYREDRGRRLMKRRSDDGVGVWEQADVSRILEAASSCKPPVGTMWAGGLDGPHVYWLAQRGAFAIFTTSTTARRVAIVDPQADPSASSDVEPTYYGVLAVRMIIEAGFLRGVADRAQDADTIASLDGSVDPVLKALAAGTFSKPDPNEGVPVLDALGHVLEPLWRTHFSAVGVGR